jgi:isoleucyl-tRNA synthetase
MSEKPASSTPKKSIAEKELDVLQYWQENSIFEKSLEKPGGVIAKQNFTFYDGPPFATGVPHHGHILAGTMKDVVPRYRTMKGEYVRRVWGWDCHGLPIENMIEKEFNLNHKKEIESFGLDKFNQACFDSVLRYEKEWKKIVPRVGRWVDMEHAYKTMDATYTESIWWSWKQLYEKKLAYEGYKIMQICPRCETTLAQSEVALGYKDVTDISVTAKFELVDEPGTFLLAWTTTPWTLPGNTALALNAEAAYAYVRYEGLLYIAAEERLEHVFKGLVYEKVKTVNGKDLVGKSYKPVFPYYVDTPLDNKENIYKVWAGEFVTLDTGTGIVHIAPAFGADDMALAKANKIPVIKHVSMSGQFTKEVTDFPELYVKKVGDTQSTDIEIVKYLAHNGKLFAKEKLAHSYPHCWRCDTPLLNYATSSWFVDVPKIKDKLIEANKSVTWVPEHIKEGRFGKWLENAHEWAVSRSRYWGAPIPVWKSEDGDVKVIGSFAEMREHMPKAKNVYFAIRHGESVSNTKGVLDGGSDTSNGLTQKGKDQAVSVLAELKEKGITKIISSPIIRAHETATIIADSLGIQVEVDDRLREFNHGDWDGKSIDDLYNDNPQFARHLHVAPRNGESHLDVRARMMRVLFDLEKKYQGEKILIVTHGGPEWMLLTGAILASDTESFEFVGADKAHIGGHSLPNAKVYDVNFKPFPNRNGVLDVHRPFIDEVKLTIGGKEYTRVPYVFDCWYESGSMPYAEIHYPFENEALFKNRLPADWIGEGLDQTRGWFYSLMVLGVALFDKAPYRNVIVNGMIMASDGQKMSKSKKNFTDPMDLVEKYGADTLRLYLMASPLVEAENTNFIDKDLEEMHRRIFVRLENVLAFYEMFKGTINSRIDPYKSQNILDVWMLSRLNQTLTQVTSGLDANMLDVAARPFDGFIDDLSVWYVRRSRERLKGDTGEDDRIAALSTFECVLLQFAKMFAPFAPFVSERVYKMVDGEKESVHLESWPRAGDVESEIVEEMKKVRDVVSKGLDARVKNAIKVRQPLSLLTTGIKINERYLGLIQDEVNVKQVSFDESLSDTVVLDLSITPELKKEGDTRELIRAIQDLRKNAGLTPKDMPTLFYSGNEEVKVFVESITGTLIQACVLTQIIYQDSVEGEETKVGEYQIKLNLA